MKLKRKERKELRACKKIIEFYDEFGIEGDSDWDVFREVSNRIVEIKENMRVCPTCGTKVALV